MAKVLIAGFCAVPGPRRVAVQLRHVIRALAPHHTVDLLVSRQAEQAYVERQGGVRILRVPLQESSFADQVKSFQRALHRQIEGADYDIVHVRDIWAAAPAAELRATHGYALVYDLARSPLGDSMAEADLDQAYARAEAGFLAIADLVLVPNAAAQRAVGIQLGEEKVALSPLGVDVDRFDWEDPPAGGAPRIVYVGAIDPGRGIRVLLRAFAAVLQKVDARLALAGPVAPDYGPTLASEIRDVGIEAQVELVGAVDHEQVPALISTATVCVVPAASELGGRAASVPPTKLYEYLACKRAVVAPRRQPVAMLVEHAREVLLFEPGDPGDLAQQILRFIDEPAFRERVATAGYERIRRDGTASSARRDLRAAYTALVVRRGLAATPPPDEAAPPEPIHDEEFEATMFEDLASASVETAIQAVPTPSDESRPPVRVIDQRAPAAADPTTGATMLPSPTMAGHPSANVRAPAPAEPWMIARIGESGIYGADGAEGDDGTATDLLPPMPSASTIVSTFVAAEISSVAFASVAFETMSENDFTAASALLGTRAAALAATATPTAPMSRVQVDVEELGKALE